MSDAAPQNLEAEESVLGGMLLSSIAAEKASAALTPEMFYRESHGIIFACMKKMSENGIPTDAITVSATLEEQGELDDISRSRIYELAALVPATANILHYATLVKKAWQRRSVLKAILEIQNDIDTLEDPISTLEQAALELEKSAADRHELVVSMKDLVAAKRLQMEHPQASKIGIRSPFAFLPELIGGRLYVLSGYMGDGKTSAALQFSSAAAEAGENVGIASAEMSKADLFDRWACQRTGLDYRKVKNPHLLDLRERATLETALTVMEPWRVHVIDDEELDPGRLRRYQRAGKYDLLIVDHLHRMGWKDRHDLENNIRTITNIAREFEVPVILLAQLSRAGDYAKPFPVPSMRQLRETAMLEAEASLVWFVYRERDDNHVQTNRSQFITAKNRYGRVGVETMYFDDASQSFKEMDWEPVESEEKKEGFPF